jgi:hypothetical protein
MRMRPGEGAECFGNHKCGPACLGCASGGIDLAGRASVVGCSAWELGSESGLLDLGKTADLNSNHSMAIPT